jgi:ABC-2 type transport system permease protein
MRELLLIARREYLAYVGAWGFWVSLLTTPVIIGVIAFMPLLLRQAEPVRPIAVIATEAGDFATVRAALEEAPDPLQDSADLEGARRAMEDPPERTRAPPSAARFIVVPPPAEKVEALRPYLTGEQRLSDGSRLYAAIFVRREGAQISLDYWSGNLTDQSALTRVRRALTEQMRLDALAKIGLSESEASALAEIRPTVARFDPRAREEGKAVSFKDSAPFILAFALAFVLWGAVISIANMLLSGVIEEKSNRILDSLLSSATPLQVLIGKLLGVALVSATLFGIWGVLGGAAVSVASAQSAEVRDFVFAAGAPQLLPLFVLCFFAGYLMFGAILISLGSLCDTVQEAQTLIGPVIMVMIVPVLLFGPAIENPNSPVVAAANWFPLFTPFLTMLRAPAGLEPIEIAGLIALMLLTVVVVLWGASKVFRAGVSGEISVSELRKRFFPDKAERVGGTPKS